MTYKAVCYGMLGLFALAAEVSAQGLGCVATADLPIAVPGFQDTIRVTRQQAARVEVEVTTTGDLSNAALRVVDKDGALLGNEYPFYLEANASRTFSVDEIYRITNLSREQRRLSSKVVQIIENGITPFGPHFQATYRNSMGLVTTPLLFTCDAFLK